MRRNLVVLQEDKNDCASACVSSIIRYYGGYLDMETIKSIINTTKDGTNAYDIVKGVKDIGLEAFGEYLEFEALEKINTKLPAIAHIKRNGIKHFVVIYKIDVKNKKILIMDPVIGLLKCNYKDFKDNYLGVILFFNKVKDIPKMEKHNYILDMIKDYLKDKKKLIIIISIISLIVFILSILNMLYYKYIIDKLFTNKTTLIKTALIFVEIVIVKNLFSYLKNIINTNLNYNFDIHITKETLKYLFCLPYNYYKNKSTGEVLSRINDLDSIKNLILNFVLNTFVDILLVLVLITVMFILNYKLAFITVLVIIIYVFLLIIFHNKFL